MREVTTTIRDEKEYEAACEEIWQLMDAEPGTPDEARLFALVNLLTTYDDEHYPIPAPSWIEFIQYHAERITHNAASVIKKWFKKEQK